MNRFIDRQKKTDDTLVCFRVKKKVEVVGCAPTPHKFFVKNLTKNFLSQKHEMLLYQSF